ncbi:prepilin-type N-terminal cleavage/methylation domain-containing protein [Candidatus Marinimicrobia bacterium]|jgi:prepilin-type N-terminal cleavage/methylation domain-containing protein|nr:prepilin-type N-terminal cleavage/methylation domain-containing protein [Candidatus Neomarinimicrobiota bacterium]|tara:strand:- start:930 stop:1325 length:396 start_codon:yes stop_codon:yes gene_type:complete
MKKKLSKGFTLVEILVVLVIVAILAGLAFVSYRGYVDKGYATEGITLLEEVSSASEMYEAMHGGQQTTLDQLEAEGLIKVVDALKRKWKIEISGDMFIATSSDEMDGGSGKEIRYDRNTGDFTGYGNEASE